MNNNERPTPDFARPTANSRSRISALSGGYVVDPRRQLSRPRAASTPDLTTPRQKSAPRLTKTEQVKEETRQMLTSLAPLQDVSDLRAEVEELKKEIENRQLRIPETATFHPQTTTASGTTSPQPFNFLKTSQSTTPLMQYNPPRFHYEQQSTTTTGMFVRPILNFIAPDTGTQPLQQLRWPKPDCFSGAQGDDVSDWIQKMELYLRAHRATEMEAIAFAVQLLKDHASRWWRSVIMHNPLVCESWTAFTEQLRRQYVAPNAAVHARSKLNQLRQTRSVHEYVRHFQLHMVDIPNMGIDEARERFLAGLKPHIQAHCRLQRPTTLEDAIADALIIDDCGMLANMDASRHTEHAHEAQAASKQDPQRPTKLTEVEKQRCLKLRLCFRCRKPGHSSRDCQSFQPRT